jgi:uncharacterized protein YqjF (DUF2071 family)
MERFLTARWVDLVMLNYEIDPAIVRPLVPRGTELDLWSGRCFASLVGFKFLDTRVLGLGVPFHRDFPEVNLRFYVRREVAGELRRGVVFVKEVVPRWALAWIANALYGEKYVALPMAAEGASGQAGPITYRWRQGERWFQLAATAQGAPYLPDDASQETFITEHYWGYAAQRRGGTLEYQVEHPRWHVWRAQEPRLECDVGAFYGATFAPFLTGKPYSCFVADGSAVVVRRGQEVTGP